MKECHKHLKVNLFGLAKCSRDIISPIYPSKLVTALTAPVLKGALSKAQANYWSFVNLLPNIPSAIHMEAL